MSGGWPREQSSGSASRERSRIGDRIREEGKYVEYSILLNTNTPMCCLAEQSASNELVKLVRKLRSMGRQEEAVAVQRKLAQHPIALADSVIATSNDTD